MELLRLQAVTLDEKSDGSSVLAAFIEERKGDEMLG